MVWQEHVALILVGEECKRGQNKNSKTEVVR